MARPGDREAIAAARRSLPRGCPLHVRANGQWGRRHDGGVITFGSVRSVPLGEALRRYHEFAAAIAAGRTPAAVGSVTVGELFAAFAERQASRSMRGALSGKTVAGYVRHLRWAEPILGSRSPVSALGRADFASLLAGAEAAGWAPATTAGMVNAVRAAMLWAVDVEILDRVPPYGRGFRRPARAAERRHRATVGRGGERAFDGEEIRRLLALASPLMRCAILLGVSCGCGQGDVSALPRSAVRGDWIDFPRPKTGIPRRAPVWPELAAALDEYARADRGRRTSETRGLVFASRAGTPLVWRGFARDAGGAIIQRETDLIGPAFVRLLVKARIRRTRGESRGLDATGLGFYSLRRTCATMLDAQGDALARHVIMGHATDGSVADAYVQRVDDERLVKVSHGVRSLLLGPASPGTRHESLAT